MEPYAFDWRRIEESRPLAVLRPGTVGEVAACVAICAESGIPLVPQGGNTGLVGGTVARPGAGAVILNLTRLDRIRDVDPLDDTITVEAGCVLARAQSAAADVDRLLPLSLGAEGTCTIGGNLASNAGGILTLRYGNARDLVLGLEVVLPDGRIWDGLRRLRKDNSGYDLKHLFLGSEGTLGIITAAVLELVPRPARMETALVAVPDVRAAVGLLTALRAASGGMLSAFELMPRFAMDGARDLLGEDLDPLAAPAPWYVLMELSGPAGIPLRPITESALEQAIADGTALDAVLASSEQQRGRLWRLREALPEIGRKVGGAVHHDISVPISRIAELIARGTDALNRMLPGIRPYPFGHVGDGNIHFNVARPADMEGAAFLARSAEITRTLHDIALDLGGSISAEHGIGSRKRDELRRVRSATELDLMRRIKSALDPADRFNPGKVLP